MSEYWADYIPGYYQVSDMGRIRSVRREVENKHGTLSIRQGCILAQSSGRGRGTKVSVDVRGIRKTMEMHRIVAEVFLENPDNLPYVRHKKGLENIPSNLYWTDDLRPVAIVSEQLVREIIDKLKCGMTTQEIIDELV